MHAERLGLCLFAFLFRRKTILDHAVDHIIATLQRGLLWAGTNDGKLWVTKTSNLPKPVWTDLTKNVKGLPEWSTIAQISPSTFDAGTAYPPLSEVERVLDIALNEYTMCAVCLALEYEAAREHAQNALAQLHRLQACGFAQQLDFVGNPATFRADGQGHRRAGGGCGLRAGRCRRWGFEQRPEGLQLQVLLRQIRPGPQPLLEIREFVGRQQPQVA